MRVDLPSAGKIGFSYYEINEPTMGQLRKVSNYPANEILCKNQFILDCTPEKEQEKFNKLTLCDRDYLFIVLVCALNLNKVSCEAVCACGTQIKFDFELSESNFTLLGSNLQYTTDTFGDPITYNTMTVEKEIEILEWVLPLPDEDYENFYEAAMVAQTLGYGVSEESVTKVLGLDLAIYYSALFYQLCQFHGVLPAVDTHCPTCQKWTVATVPFTKALLTLDITSIMKSFMAFSTILDFQSFCNMTVTELQNLRVLIEDRNSRGQ
jgi:hypothetical protein